MAFIWQDRGVIMIITGHSDFFPLLKRGIEEGTKHEN
jgi:hypothetical protein